VSYSERRLSGLALVVVDMQNDFVRVGAPLEVPKARGTINAHLELLAAFRSRNLPVIYTKFLSMPEEYLLWNWSPQCRPPTKCCWKGHIRHYPDVDKELDCTEIIEELAPLPEDVVIEKFGYGAFHGTPLVDILLNRKIQALAITGTVTQVCVEETARESFHHGFLTTVIEDAVSSNVDELHEATLKNFARKFGWVESSRSFLAKLN
jgi:nicotinamidase-related amidase